MKINLGSRHAGQKFGRLLVISDNERNDHGRRVATAICECGKTVKVLWESIRSGNTKSCGCFSLDQKRSMLMRHGLARTAEYRAWADMWQRCTNPRCRNYRNYGARGIRVCDRWREFTLFFEDMGKRPRAGLSLERMDVNGNYEPSNCTWATISAQNFNKRSHNKFRGVRPSRHDGKRYESRIVKEGRTYHLGTFDTAEEAVDAYNKKAKELYGPHAFQNGVRANAETLML